MSCQELNQCSELANSVDVSVTKLDIGEDVWISCRGEELAATWTRLNSGLRRNLSVHHCRVRARPCAGRGGSLQKHRKESSSNNFSSGSVTLNK